MDCKFVCDNFGKSFCKLVSEFYSYCNASKKILSDSGFKQYIYIDHYDGVIKLRHQINVLVEASIKDFLPKYQCYKLKQGLYTEEYPHHDLNKLFKDTWIIGIIVNKNKLYLEDFTTERSKYNLTAYISLENADMLPELDGKIVHLKDVDLMPTCSKKIQFQQYYKMKSLLLSEYLSAYLNDDVLGITISYCH